MNHKPEIWKDIVGYEGLYQVSNMGNVRSLYRTVRCGNKDNTLNGKLLTPAKNKCGYLYVNLRKNGETKSKNIHRLVAEHFVPNPMCKPQVNHLDENKENNKADNLDWVTAKENANHGSRNYKISEYRKQNVVAINEISGEKIFFETVNEANCHFGIKGHNIVYDKVFTYGKKKGWKYEKCEKKIV